MSSNLISSDELIEPFEIIKEFQVKAIGNLNSYTKRISDEMQILDGLSFDPEFKKLIDFGKAISNDIRIKMLFFIKRVGRSCFCELKKVFDLKQSTLNYHVGLLKRAGLIETFKEGKLIVLTLSESFSGLEGLAVFNLFNESR